VGKQLRLILPLIGLVLLLNLVIIKIPTNLIQEAVTRTGVFAPAIFVLISLLSYIIAPISGTPVMTVGYYLFGDRVILLGYLAVILSSISNFYISRLWGIGPVTKLVGKENFQKFEKFTINHGLVKLFVMRFFLAGYNDFISYAYGLGKIKFWPYFAASATSSFLYSVMIFLIIKQNPGNINLFIIVLVGIGVTFITLFGLVDTLFHRHQRS